MNIFMLGWEFPPRISGGLGTACYGLTRALSNLGHRIVFVVPQPIESRANANVGRSAKVESRSRLDPSVYESSELQNVRFRPVPAGFFAYGYPRMDVDSDALLDDARGAESSRGLMSASGESSSPRANEKVIHSRAETDGADSLWREVARYGRLARRIAREDPFDVVHAHDWMTFPAASEIARRTNRPFVAHVHSTEFDREPNRPDPRICRFESEGLRRAHRIIAVSGYTRDTLVRQYGIDAAAVDVVHNAVDCDAVSAGSPADGASSGAKREPRTAGDGVVLFLGRITAQKGPQHFLAMARRVLSVRPQTRFVMAGDGDLALFARCEARRLGIAERVTFPGFLDRRGVDRALAEADVFVMPSVSEPFGIVALEAMNAGVPTIVSRQSGVAQVVRHALAFDCWETDAQARAIVELLDDSLRRAMLGALGREEVGRLTWRASADRCVDAYQAAGEFRMMNGE